jgi:hypothetical protein
MSSHVSSSHLVMKLIYWDSLSLAFAPILICGSLMHSIKLYDSFAGTIYNKGNIMSSLKIPVLFGATMKIVDSTRSVDLNVSIDSQLQGE